MKLTEADKAYIIAMKKEGFGSRHIADNIGCGKSTVNDFYVAWKSDGMKEVDIHKPKILVFDLETAAATALTFGRYNVNLSQANIIDEGGWILCACAKWLGDDKVMKFHLQPEEIYPVDDSRIVAQMIELFEEASAVVAHNGKKFDIKVLQTRALANGYGALPTVKVIDTLVMAKSKLKLPSNKLDSIGEYFKLGNKIDTGGITLWKEVQSQDINAMQRMVQYCEQDVKLLEEVYLKLRSLGNVGSNFNAGLNYEDDKVHCPTCGSTDIEETGRTVSTNLSTFIEVMCHSCGSVHRTRKALNTKEQRSTLLQPL